MDLAPRTRRKAAGRSGIWSWMGLGVFVAVLLGVVSLKVNQEHGAHSKVLPVPAVQLAGRAAARAARR
jgi:hypothetical protein